MAVLVGCSHYIVLPALPTVSAGLDDLWSALTDSVTGGFTPGRCQVIAEPTDPGHLARALLEAARATQDTLLVYYAGHGVLDEDNNLHLALTKTSNDQALVPETALSFRRVRAILRASPARNRIVILDCCFAGRAIHDMTGPGLSAHAVITGSYVLTATGADQTARALDGTRHTAFTGALLNLLQQGIPEGPDLLTLEAIYPHLRHALIERGLPEPHRQGIDTAANLALARNPTPRFLGTAPGQSEHSRSLEGHVEAFGPLQIVARIAEAPLGPLRGAVVAPPEVGHRAPVASDELILGEGRSPRARRHAEDASAAATFSRRRRSSRPLIAGGIASAIVIGVAAAVFAVRPSVDIKLPRDAHVLQQVAVGVEAHHIPDGSNVWLVTQGWKTSGKDADDHFRYFPATSSCENGNGNGNGAMFCPPASFGNMPDRGKCVGFHYHLLAVLADQQVMKAFNDYVAARLVAGEPDEGPGMLDLPRGSKTLADVPLVC